MSEPTTPSKDPSGKAVTGEGQVDGAGVTAAIHDDVIDTQSGVSLSAKTGQPPQQSSGKTIAANDVKRQQ